MTKYNRPCPGCVEKGFITKEGMATDIYAALDGVRYPSRREDPTGEINDGMERVDTAVRTAIDKALSA